MTGRRQMRWRGSVATIRPAAIARIGAKIGASPSIHPSIAPVDQPVMDHRTVAATRVFMARE